MNTPWSTLPICHGPAITPQRSITVRQPVGRGVLGHQQLGRELRRAVERARALEREVLGDAGADAPGTGCSASSSKRVSASRKRSALERGDRIDAAGREEDHLRAVAARELEAVVGADQVGCDDVVRRAVDAGHAPTARPSTRRSRRPGRAPRRSSGARARRRGRTRRPPARRRGRLSSEPRRLRLSSATSSQSGWRSASPTQRFAPTKPAPPVMRTRFTGSRIGAEAAGRSRWAQA